MSQDGHVKFYDEVCTKIKIWSYKKSLSSNFQQYRHHKKASQDDLVVFQYQISIIEAIIFIVV